MGEPKGSQLLNLFVSKSGLLLKDLIRRDATQHVKVSSRPKLHEV
jgi:hypothetical protein